MHLPMDQVFAFYKKIMLSMDAAGLIIAMIRNAESLLNLSENIDASRHGSVDTFIWAKITKIL